MPRVKQSKATRATGQAMSTDEPAPFVAEGQSDAVPEVVKPVKVKKARVAKQKPCARCEERRERERKYAKTSRARARAAATPAPTPSGDVPPPDDATLHGPPAGSEPVV